jgi:hypothetical protein
MRTEQGKSGAYGLWDPAWEEARRTRSRHIPTPWNIVGNGNEFLKNHFTLLGYRGTFAGPLPDRVPLCDNQKL